MIMAKIYAKETFLPYKIEIETNIDIKGHLLEKKRDAETL